MAKHDHPQRVGPASPPQESSGTGQASEWLKAPPVNSEGDPGVAAPETPIPAGLAAKDGGDYPHVAGYDPLKAKPTVDAQGQPAMLNRNAEVGSLEWLEFALYGYVQKSLGRGVETYPDGTPYWDETLSDQFHLWLADHESCLAEPSPR